MKIKRKLFGVIQDRDPESSVGRHLDSKANTAYGQAADLRAAGNEKEGTAGSSAAKGYAVYKLLNGKVGTAIIANSVGNALKNDNPNKQQLFAAAEKLETVKRSTRAKSSAIEALITKARGGSVALNLSGLSIEQSRIHKVGRKTSNNGATGEGGPQQHAQTGGAKPGDHALVQSMVVHHMADGSVVMRRRQVRTA
jgi:hypothetical protein